MRIWRLSDPRDYGFARASRRGTWTESKGTCNECGASTQRRVQPLVIEWEPDSDVVGDFVWPGFGGDIAITERVVGVLKGRFTAFEPGPVEMYQDPKLKRTKRGKPRVWLPYEGPPLYDLWVTCWVGIDHDRSTVSLVKKCSICGTAQYSLAGAEKWELGWDQERMESVQMHIPRGRGEGLFVRRAELGDADLFHVNEFPAAIFCSDRVKKAIEAESFTNVGFLEVGEIV